MSRPDPAGYLPLYLVTDAGLSRPRQVQEIAELAVDGGVTCVQVRDKSDCPRTLLDQVLAVAAAVGDRVPVIVNDRVDVFLSARAIGAAVHGVHVGQDDLPTRQVRALVGPDAIVGLSATTPAELARACAPEVDYVGVGPVRATATKPDAAAPLGLAGLADALRHARVPAVAIGGVGAADAITLHAAGATGLAVVSAICAADDPRQAARDLATAWWGREATA